MYGLTFTFGFNLARAVKTMGYDYIGILFYAPLNTVFARLEQRNGGKAINYMNIQENWKRAYVAFQKLKSAKVNVKLVDTSKIAKERLYEAIENELQADSR